MRDNEINKQNVSNEDILRADESKQEDKTTKYIDDLFEKLKSDSVRHTRGFVDYFNEKSEESKLEYFRKYGKYGDGTQLVGKHSEYEQIEAVKSNGYAICDIKEPSEAVQLEAVRQNGNSIYYIDDPTERVQSLIKKASI